MTDATQTPTEEAPQGNRRMNREVRRETRETLRYIELNRIPREEKRKLEAEAFSDAPEAEFFEKGWKKRQPEPLREIQAYVDRLGLQPEPPAPAAPTPEAAPVPAAAPEPEVEPAKAAGAETLELPATRPLTDEEQAALARAIPGEITKVTVIYRASRGQIVEVTFVHDGKPDTTIVRVSGETVQDLETIRTRVEEMPVPADAPAVVVEPLETPEPAPAAPEAPAPAAEQAPAPQPVEAAPTAAPEPAAPAAPAPEAEPTKKSRFGFGKKKDKAEEKPAEAAPAPEAAPAEKKSRFGFGKKKAEEKQPEAPTAEQPAPESAEKKSRFGFGKKKDKAEEKPAEGTPDPAPAAESPAPEATPAPEKKGALGKLKGGLPFGRKK